MEKSQLSKKIFRRTFYRVFLIIVGVMIVLMAIMEYEYVVNLQNSNRNELYLESNLLVEKIEHHVSHTTFLSKVIAESAATEVDWIAFNKQIERLLYQFAEENRIYDQVRFLDPNGLEVVRINQVNDVMYIVPDDELQDKSSRDYFKRARDLERNQVYITRMDLNIENEAIEYPYRPIIRLITPVFQNNLRIGYVVLNVRGQSYIDRLTSTQQITCCELYLINQEGYWLKGPEGSLEWDFMFSEEPRPGALINDFFPDVWETYQSEHKDQVLSFNGLVAFQELDPSRVVQMELNPQVEIIYEDVQALVSYAPLSRLLNPALLFILLLGVFLVVLAAVLVRSQTKSRVNEQISRKLEEESIRKFEIMANTSQDAIIFINSAGVVTYWNGAFKKIFGYSDEDLANTNIHYLIATKEDDLEAALTGMAESVGDDQKPAFGRLWEIEAKRKSGETFWAEISLQSAFMDGEWMTASVIRDISARKALEMEIREVAKFPEENADPVLRVSVSMKVLYANKAAENALSKWRVKGEWKIPAVIQKRIESALEANRPQQISREIDRRVFNFSVVPVVDSGYANLYLSDITEKERAVHELQKSEIRFRRIFENSPFGIFQLNSENMQLISINKAMAGMFGYDSAQEFIHTVGADPNTIKPDIRDLLKSFEEEVRSKEEYQISDLDFSRKDGSLLTTNLFAVAVRNERGKFDYVEGYLEDVTERRKAEREVRELTETLEERVRTRTAQLKGTNQQLAASEKRYRRIVQDHLDYLIRWAPKGEVTFINNSLKNRYELRASGDNESIREAVEVIPAFKRLVQNAALISAEDNTIDLEVSVKLPGGQVEWEQWRIGAIFNDENEIEEYQAVGRNVTASKRNSIQMQLQSTAIESSADAVLITDLNGSIKYANQAFSKLTGYSAEEIKNSKPSILKSGKHDPAFYAQMWAAIKAGRVWEGEIINRRKSGEDYYEEMTITPVRTTNNQITHFIAVKRDITERKKFEETLSIAREKAEAANRTKSLFLANMSHEIRTPLNAILGYIYLMERTDLAQTQLHQLQKMRSSADTLLSTINDILDFSKIEAGKISLEIMPFRLDELMQEICDIVSMKAHEKNLEILFNIPERLPMKYEGDPIRLRQILLNLINNAIKFSEKGKIEVQVESLQEEGEKMELQFCITDKGIGIDPETLKDLFTPFTQADSSTTRKFGGTGLGLSISKELIEKMEGKIWAESELGSGSRFYFTVKLRMLEEISHEKISRRKKFSDRKVMVIDREEGSRSFICEYLESLKMNVVGIESVPESVQLLGQMPDKSFPDLLVLNSNAHQFKQKRQVKGLIRMVHRQGAGIAHIVSVVDEDNPIWDLSEFAFDCVLRKPISQSKIYNCLVMLFMDTSKEIGQEKDMRSGPQWGEKVAGVSVLVAEDNEINQDVIASLLKLLKMDVTIAGNGQQAVHLLQEKVFDIILMDIQMPVMDGFQATRIIRASAESRDIPIIALSANVVKEEKENAFQAGVDDYLTKPIEPDKLYAAIAKWIGKESPAAEKQVGKSEPSLMGTTQVEGLDIEAGVYRVGNNMDTYRRILEKFTRSHRDDLNQARGALIAGDVPSAKKLLHALKGVSANIGAVRLPQLIADLEELIAKGSAEEVNALLETTMRELDRIVRSIEGNTDPAQEAAQKSRHTFDPSQYVEMHEKLKVILEKATRFDVSAKADMEAMVDSFKGTPYAEMSYEILENLDQYNYHEAKAQIQSLLELFSEGQTHEK